MHTNLLVRGINFPAPAPAPAQSLAGQVAHAFGVRHRWVCGGRRLEVLGPPEAVESFFQVARAALVFGSPAMAEA